LKASAPVIGIGRQNSELSVALVVCFKSALISLLGHIRCVFD
jgi:hypothetical protein